MSARGPAAVVGVSAPTVVRRIRIDGPNPVNNIPFAARVTGPVDVEALVRRRSATSSSDTRSFGSTYREIDGAPMQMVNEAVRRCLFGTPSVPDGSGCARTLDAERHYCFELETELTHTRRGAVHAG